MANFNGFVLTNEGRKLLAKAISGETLTFTKLAFGDGEYRNNENNAQDIKEITELVQLKNIFEINQVKHISDGKVMLKIILNNKNVSQGYYMKEVGIFAYGNDKKEILYAYNEAIEADYLPAFNGNNLIEFEYQNYVLVDQAKNVTALINESIAYITKEEVDERFVPQTQIATIDKEGIISEKKVKNITQEIINKNKARYDTENNKLINGLVNVNDWDTGITAHLNFYRVDQKEQDWWNQVPNKLKDSGWDGWGSRFFMSTDGSYLGVHKARNNGVYSLLDTSLMWAGQFPNYLNNSGGSKLVMCDQYDAFVPDNIRFFKGRDTTKYLGLLHYSENGAPYHQGPRTNWNWSRLLDEIDLYENLKKAEIIEVKHPYGKVLFRKIGKFVSVLVYLESTFNNNNYFRLSESETLVNIPDGFIPTDILLHSEYPMITSKSATDVTTRIVLRKNVLQLYGTGNQKVYFSELKGTITYMID